MVVTVIRIEIHSPPPAQRWWSCSEVLPCRLIIIIIFFLPPDYGTVLNHHWWSWLISSLWWGTWAWRRHFLLHKIWHFTKILLHWRSWQRAAKKQKDSSHLPFYTLWRKPTVFHTTLLLHLTNIWSHVFILCQWGPLRFQGDSLLVYIQTILQESSSKGPNVNYGSWLMMKVMTWYCRWHV